MATKARPKEMKGIDQASASYEPLVVMLEGNIVERDLCLCINMLLGEYASLHENSQ